MNPLTPHELQCDLKKLYLLDPIQKPGRYAFRIGFIGGLINRYDEDLLGKVIDSQEFELFNSDNQLKTSATFEAKEILSNALSSYYPKARQRLIHACLTGENEWTRATALQDAWEWLKSRDIDAIYFQYRWMVTPLMTQALGTNFRPVNESWAFT